MGKAHGGGILEYAEILLAGAGGACAENHL